MSLEDWSGVDQFMSGQESGDEWIHFVMQDTPSYMESHRDATAEAADLRQAYMMAYGEENYDLIDPSTKYSSEGLTDN